MIRPLVGPDAPVLRQRAAEVAIDDTIRALIKDMFETMRVHHGLGLAAPQVGLSQQVAVVEVNGITTALVNPRVIGWMFETKIAYERCLSLPGVEVAVERPMFVTIEATNEFGVRFTLDVVGLAARVIQHELDHLAGVLIVDKAYEVV